MTNSCMAERPRRANYLEVVVDADTPEDLIALLVLLIEQLGCESSVGIQTKSMPGYDAKIYHEKKSGPSAYEYQQLLASSKRVKK